jgi:hypothetical protein
MKLQLNHYGGSFWPRILIQYLLKFISTIQERHVNSFSEYLGISSAGQEFESPVHSTTTFASYWKCTFFSPFLSQKNLVFLLHTLAAGLAPYAVNSPFLSVVLQSSGAR